MENHLKKRLKEGTYILHSLKEKLSCGICDNCNVPKMKNSGDGINEPLDPYLFCPKKNIEISPSPENEQLKTCDFFEADRGIIITKNYDTPTKRHERT